MANSNIAPEKDPDSIEPYFFIWCGKDGVNDGSVNDKGELQGATISSYTVTIAGTGLTKDSDNKSSATVHGVTYAASTLVTVWLSSGVDNTDYSVTCRIVTNESPPRTLDKTMVVPVRSQ